MSFVKRGDAENLIAVVKESTPLKEAIEKADDVLKETEKEKRLSLEEKNHQEN